MKIFTCLLISIFSLSALKAQNTLHGIVRDKTTGAGIESASVYLSDLKRLATTDSLGKYEFKNLPQGSYLLEVRAFTYTAQNHTVTVSGNTTFNLELDETHTELNEVVITGVSQATELKKSAVPVSILNRKQLLATNSTNLIDALSHVPGVQSISTGAAVAKPVIRGLGYNRIITLYDGMRQEGQQWGDEHGIEIDEYGVERIEIIKGPASLMYGSDGIAGVINILSPKPLPEGKKEARLYLNHQTNNNLNGASLSYAGNNSRLYWDTRLSGKIAGNYRNKYDGYVQNSAFNELNGAASIGINKKWGYSHLSATSFYQNIGLPEGERDSLGRFVASRFINDSTLEEYAPTQDELKTTDIFYPRQQILHNRILLSNSFIAGKGRITANIGFQQNRRKEYEQPEMRLDDAPLPVLYMKLQTWNYDFKYFLPQMKGFSSSVGINGMYQQNRNHATEYIIPDYNLADAGIYAYTKKSFNKSKTELSGGLRYDFRNLQSHALFENANGSFSTVADTNSSVKFRQLDLNFTNLSGSIGATHALSKNFFLKANLARGYRSPNIAELSANGVHEGTFRYEIGNGNLKPETSLQGDIGLNFNTDHFTLEAAVFRNQINHYIYIAKLPAVHGGDSFPDPEVNAVAYTYQQGNALLNGGEIMMDIHPHPFDWLHFQNSFSYVRGTLQNQPDSLHNLPLMPPMLLQSELRVTKKKLGSYLQNLSFELEFDHYFAQENILAAYNTETTTPTYNLLNAGISMDIVSKKGKPLASVNLLAGNLTNTAYQNHLSRLKYAPENVATGRTGIYNMGRNFSIKLDIPLYSK